MSCVHRNLRVDKCRNTSITARASPSDTDSDHHNHHDILSQREVDELRSTTWRRKLSRVIHGEGEDEPQWNWAEVHRRGPGRTACLISNLQPTVSVMHILNSDVQFLVTKQKNRSNFYEYSPSKSSGSSEMLEVF
ncbi:hypothetical protein YC2023_083920 [Brassica napus]